MSEFSDSLNVSCGRRKASEDSTDVSTLLHRDDAELILLIDPDKESLGIIVEDAPAFGPVAVETTGIKEAVTLLEEEVVSNQLLLLSFSHGSKRIECSGKLTLEGIASLNDLLLNSIALLAGNSRTKREVSQVATNSDTSRLDHGGILRWERRALEFRMVHVTDMTSIFAVTMVLLNDLVHERSEGLIRLMAACIDTDA